MSNSVMVNVPIGAGLVEEASGASRRDQTGRREIGYASANKAVTERLATDHFAFFFGGRNIEYPGLRELFSFLGV